MSDNSLVSDDTQKNIEECPPPPRYINSFIDSTTVPDPPTIPSEFSLYNKIYNGILPKIRTRNLPYNSSRNYKADLKILLNSVLDKALPFIHVSEVSNFDVEQAVTELRQALVDIHTCLEEYRHHEGRELLVHEMKSQLDVIKNLERDLESCYLTNGAILKSSLT